MSTGEITLTNSINMPNSAMLYANEFVKDTFYVAQSVK